MSTEVVLESRIPEIIAAASAKAALAVAKTAADIEAGAKERSRIDTGLMKGGWTTEPNGALEALVYNPVEYTIYNEFGTESSPAQPMLIPAVEDARGPFTAAMAQVYG